MTRMFPFATALAVLVGAGAVASAQTPPREAREVLSAAQGADPASPVPPAVLDAYRKRFPTAVIWTVSSIPSVGGITWRVEGTDSGFARDLSCLADLSVITFREGVSTTALPEAVTAGAGKIHPGLPITTAARLTSGSNTRYLLTLKGPEDVVRVALTPDGEVAAPSGPARPPTLPAQQAGAVSGAGAYRPGSGVETPRLLREVKPQYTAAALRAKIAGTVVLECVVLTDGTVGECQVVRSLDAQLGLDQEAIKAARQWRFAPGRRLGQAVPVKVIIELAFTPR